MSELTEATGLAAVGFYLLESKDDLLISICDELLAPCWRGAREIVATDSRPEGAASAPYCIAWLAQRSPPTATTCWFFSPRSATCSSAGSQWRRRARPSEGLRDAARRSPRAGEADGTMRLREDPRLRPDDPDRDEFNSYPQWLNTRGRSAGGDRPTANANLSWGRAG